MTYTHTIAFTWSSPSETNIGGSISQTSDTVESVQLAVTNATDGKQLFIGWKNADLKSLFIVADRAMTLFSNVDGGAGNDTVALVAGVPKVYQAGQGMTNPFNTADVVSLFVDNLSGSDGTLNIRILKAGAP